MDDGLTRELIDRQQINEVLIEYCGALDQMDLARLAALFTDDCVVNYGPDPRLQSRGASALRKSLQRMWRWSRTSHHLGNVLIEFSCENEALVRSYVFAWHERPDGSTATIFGQYHDAFVREDGRWRIAERRMLMNGCDAGFTVNINRLERQPAPRGWVAPDIDARN
jgi:ketosteroid isomerase-like protein